MILFKKPKNQPEKLKTKERLYSYSEVERLVCLAIHTLNSSELITKNGLNIDSAPDLYNEGVAIIIRKDDLLEKMWVLKGGEG